MNTFRNNQATLDIFGQMIKRPVSFKNIIVGKRTLKEETNIPDPNKYMKIGRDTEEVKC